MVDLSAIGRMIENVKLGNGFLSLGIVMSTISVYVNHDIGLKIGLLTFLFGGGFRILNIPTKNIKNPLIRFVIWFLFLLIYAYLLNNIFYIF